MYRLEFSYDERCMIELQLFHRIAHLRELREELTDDIWNDSTYPSELEEYMALYLKVRDCPKIEEVS